MKKCTGQDSDVMTEHITLLTCCLLVCLFLSEAIRTPFFCFLSRKWQTSGNSGDVRASTDPSWNAWALPLLPPRASRSELEMDFVLCPCPAVPPWPGGVPSSGARAACQRARLQVGLRPLRGHRGAPPRAALEQRAVPRGSCRLCHLCLHRWSRSASKICGNAIKYVCLCTKHF